MKFNEKWLLNYAQVVNVLPKELIEKLGESDVGEEVGFAFNVLVHEELAHVYKMIEEMSSICNLTISDEEIRGYCKAFGVIRQAMESEEKDNGRD